MRSNIWKAHKVVLCDVRDRLEGESDGQTLAGSYRRTGYS